VSDVTIVKTSSGAFTVGNTFSDYYYDLKVKNIGLGSTLASYTVSDAVNAGLEIVKIDAGSDFSCSAASQLVTCVGSRVLGTGEEAAGIRIHVRPRLTILPAGVTSINIQNQAVVSGGGELLSAGDNNESTVTSSILAGGSVSGSVFLDDLSDGNRITDFGVPGFWVQLIDTNDGSVITQVKTDSSGHYRFTGLTPNQPYEIIFRDDNNGVPGEVRFGTPVSYESGNTGTSQTRPTGVEQSVCSGVGATTGSCVTGTTLGISEVLPTRNALRVQVSPNQELVQQSLPLDPSGVVYDSVARTPVAGSKVTLQSPVGCSYNFTTDLFGASNYVITPDGKSATMTVGATGLYQFLLSSSPGVACDFILSVTPPTGYIAPSTMIPVQSGVSPTPGGAGVWSVQTQAGAPQGSQSTTYYLIVRAGAGVNEVIHNHIPVDPSLATSLGISKVVNKPTAEIADSLEYTVTVRNPGLAIVTNTVIQDRLPEGFKYILGTAKEHTNLTSSTYSVLANPDGGVGRDLQFHVSDIPVNGFVEIKYRVRVGVGARMGENINIATARGKTGASDVGTLLPAQAVVKIEPGVFITQGCVFGKVFVDCNENLTQQMEEIGIPGVRLYLEDGTYFVTDSEGKYSYCGVDPKTHVIKVDTMTLPIGSRLSAISNRHAGVGDSQFVDVKMGEWHRADFVEMSCTATVMDQVKARASQGEVNTPYIEKTGRVKLSLDQERYCEPDTAVRQSLTDGMTVFDSGVSQQTLKATQSTKTGNRVLAPLRNDACSSEENSAIKNELDSPALNACQKPKTLEKTLIESQKESIK
jgi:uncharacterized repeat protein (TIGR01451 family)